MKQLFFLSILLHLFFSAGAQDGTKEKFRLPEGITAGDYLPNTLIIKLKPDTGSRTKRSAEAAIPSLLSAGDIQIVSLKKKFPDTAPQAKTSAASKRNNYGLDRIYELKFTGSDNIEKVINELLENSSVEYAEPSYIYKAYYEPNDPAYLAGIQTYLEQVKAVQAWDITRNASNIIIAIVDSGSDINHPDLAPNIWINTADPIDGIDNDGDGYIDNYYGWDFIGASGSSPKEDNDPNVKSSSNDHGVHVSGIASAVSDNGLGVASIAFNAKLLIVKTASDNDAESIYAGPEGIKYAADKGAQIINCSWGSTGRSFYVEDVVNYAINRGCLIVAAAGNSAGIQPDYPAGYPGVMAVANVNSSDVKSISSNYGSYVSISAPGTQIYSTGYNGSYKYSSGTSMAAPVVASAAALVKAKFPSMSMLEVGERLRITADNIDAQNPGFQGMLGKGRLNVYRALTESPPSVRYQNITVTDNHNQSFLPGDTITLYFDLKNFLEPASALEITLSSSSPNVSILSGSQEIALLAHQESKSHVGPFLVRVELGTPDNTPVTFRLNYTANGGSYNDHETFTVEVSLDYINYEANQITSTISSNGRVGFSKTDGTGGAGFVYKDTQLLFEASLMIGNSSSRVSNNARSVDSESSEHFIKKRRAETVPTDAAFEGVSEFDDSGSPLPLNIYVKNRHTAYSSAPDDKYILVDYTILNKSDKRINNLYAGLFTDWDLDQNDNNVTLYDAAGRLGYVYAVKNGQPYAGVKLLNENYLPAYYPMSITLANDILQDGFTTAEKFQTLSSGIKSQGLGQNKASGYDVMYTIGYGPFDIAPSDSVKISFAFLTGDDLADLQQSASAAQAKFNTLNEVKPPLDEREVILLNYPNPASEFTKIEFSIPASGAVSLALYDLAGRRVKIISENKQYISGTYSIPLDLTGLQTGVYICRLRFNSIIKARSISVLR